MIDIWALSPWTDVSLIDNCELGALLLIVEIISWKAAVEEDVTTQICFGEAGTCNLFLGSNNPSASSFFLRSSNFCIKLPEPAGWILLTIS